MSELRADLLAALMRQLEETQWLPAEELATRQYRQLTHLAAHAVQYSSDFRQRMRAAGLSPIDLSMAEGLRRLPVLTRRDIQSVGSGLFCTQLPKAHLPLAENHTSGSTGEPVVVRRTAINQQYWLAATLREHLWHRRDFRGRLAIIRANMPAEKIDTPDWGPPVSLLYASGPAHGLSISTPVGRQAEWLGRLNPDYLLTYPTNLAALLRELRQRGITLPGLRQVRTIGETLSDDIRQACENQLKVDVADTYSSQEVGNIAIQCPMSGLYHVMSEYLLVEVLDDAGQPCVPGQTGRVVVTDLLNFATPLIRYEIGDYAEAGASCPCGRGLPTLRRIAGRERNMVLLPDGSRHWPLVGFQRFRQIAPIRQYQIIQHSLQAIEVRLVVDAPLDASQQSLLQDVIRQSLGYAFDLEFIFHHQEIPRSKNGKFEEFVCLIKNHS